MVGSWKFLERKMMTERVRVALYALHIMGPDATQFPDVESKEKEIEDTIRNLDLNFISAAVTNELPGGYYAKIELR
jgi:hypothetical protein